MTWLSHSSIATAIALPLSPAHIPVIVLGSTAPDWIEYVLNALGLNVEHRKETHYVVLWLFLICLSFFIDFNSMLFWFAIGGLSHVLEDSLTVSGVPFSPYSTHRFHLFGGALSESSFYRFRTGSMVEYIIAFSILGASVFLVNPFSNFIQNYNKSEEQKSKFNAYYMDYKKLYEEGVIDEKEYKELRFKMF
jgi:inner membrane protein